MAWSRESRHKRGYGTAWDKLREQILQRDCGLCQPCKKQHRTTAAKQVDHIVSKAKATANGWTQAMIDAPSNLQAICVPCHEAKTLEESGKKKRVRTKPDVDGWPVPA